MTLNKFCFAITLAMPVLAAANSIEIRRDTVLEVVSDQTLTVRDAREGDKFSVTVNNDRDLPRGTQLIGEILRIEEKSRDRDGFMDLEFRTLQLPDGTRQDIQAIPIALNSKSVRKDRDGRFYADAKKVKTEYYAAGGFIGGLVLGSLLKKPFEGAFLGTIAGILIGESERKSAKNQDLVLQKGSKLGAVVLEDFEVNYDNRYDNDRDRDRDRYRNDDDRLGSQGSYDRDYNRDDRYGRDDRRYRDYHNSRNTQNDCLIEFQNSELQFDRIERPYWQDRTIMVSAEATARQLGLEYKRQGDRIYLGNDRDQMKLRVGERTYRFRGARQGEFEARVEDKNGEVFVPIEALAPLLSRPIYANGIEVRSPA